ncbi:hypothetical protein [Marinilabilia salmonicolor]|uniref:hypothetical protein n=1 Tax=Marinilabilia salmonicolor TaxID=989 RepID=UPI00029A6012|nr:hypothetical protein [Marinilabilia salmonicolor]
MNKNIILIFIEIAIFLTLLVFGILIVMNPDNTTYKAVISASGVLLFGAEIYRRFISLKRTKSDININLNPANTIFCYYINDKNKKLVTVLFYDLQIVNKSDKPFTIKEVQIEYYFQGEKIVANPFYLFTISEYSPHEKKKVDTLIVHTPMGKIGYYHWNNIQQEIAKNNILSSGGILRASCSFILNINSVEKASQIKHLKVIIKDYNGDKTKHPVFIQEKSWRNHKNTYVYSK